MNLDEFLKRLRALNFEWRLANGRVRTGDPNKGTYTCPIKAVADGAGIIGVYDAAQRLGLDDDTAMRIVASADKKGRSEFRAQLLEACGLPAEPI